MFCSLKRSFKNELDLYPMKKNIRSEVELYSSFLNQPFLVVEYFYIKDRRANNIEQFYSFSVAFIGVDEIRQDKKNAGKKPH